MKHKHAEMIKAKADDMDLVVFINRGEVGGWIKTNVVMMFNNEDSDFFMCLPKHEKACLHWLNGGEVEFECGGAWHSCETWSTSWSGLVCGFMQKDNVIRIKPRKEKRWVIAKPTALASMYYFGSESDAKDAVKYSTGEFKGGQVIEIEIEV